mgnify:CR=1 FL=1
MVFRINEEEGLRGGLSARWQICAAQGLRRKMQRRKGCSGKAVVDAVKRMGRRDSAVNARLRSVFPADAVGTPAAAGLEGKSVRPTPTFSREALRREQANPLRSALLVSAHCDVWCAQTVCRCLSFGNRRDARREKGPLSESLLIARWATAAWGRSAYRSLAGRWWNTAACGRQTILGVPGIKWNTATRGVRETALSCRCPSFSERSRKIHTGNHTAVVVRLLRFGFVQ